MDKEKLMKIASNFIENSADNYITEEIAISEDVVGMKIFDEPILGFGSTEDEFFNLLKRGGIIGEHFLHPKEWLERSKTVITFFLPFSKVLKNSNKKDMLLPSEGWLHGRMEGQALIKMLCMYLKDELINEGYDSIVPSYDERFRAKINFDKEGPNYQESFTSNWSERHVAYICGLGTFGLSKGIITKKGIAGRFGSIITELYLSPDQREYKEIYEYCSMCGACVQNCPVNTISLENGKEHPKCAEFLDMTAEMYEPRYGCGKCQVSVPCESGIPLRQNNI